MVFMRGGQEVDDGRRRTKEGKEDNEEEVESWGYAEKVCANKSK